jgi:hypothetical protein
MSINNIVKMGARGAVRRTRTTLLGLLLAGLFFTSQAHAQFLYRWINENGTKEYSHAISNDMVSRGYDVLDGQTMQLIRIVEPQLSEQEYAAKLEREREVAECQRALRRVTTLYQSLEDIDQAELQMLKSMDSRIANAQANLALAENQKLELEREAANKDRAGELLQSAFINNIARVDVQIDTQRGEIAKRTRDKQQAKLDFTEDRLVFDNRFCATGVATR